MKEGTVISNWLKINDTTLIDATHVVAVKRNGASYEMESLVFLDNGQVMIAEDQPEKLIEKILEGENK